MQVGSFSHQVALAVPMGPYNDFSERITSVQPARVVDDEVGYLILVARNQNDGQRSWEVLLAGSRDQVLQPGLLLNGGADVLGEDAIRLEGWFHRLIDTAVPVSQIKLTSITTVQIQLALTAQLLQRITALPMTLQLRAEGAFNAEQSLISLDVETPEALAWRLAWLLDLSREPRPVFQPVQGEAIDQLGLYLARLHAKQLQRLMR